jgi:hypothetical protein
MLAAGPNTGSADPQPEGVWSRLGPKIGNQVSKLNPALLVGLLGWFVGLRLSTSWSLRQKSKGLDLATARDFQRSSVSSSRSGNSGRRRTSSPTRRRR